MKYKLLFLFLLIGITLSSYNYFSPMSVSERIFVTETDLMFHLKTDKLIINSEIVLKDSTQLQKQTDYLIDYSKNTITFFQAFGAVEVSYLKIPADLIEKYRLYEIQVYSDSTNIKLPRFKRKQYSSEMNLNIAGSKTLSVSVANNEDFSLDQTLFLRINGDLSKSMKIEAQLSDSQSPITPEGNSRELSNLDQIYMKLYGNNFEIAFGDLETEFKNTQFINYSPKFEGLKATWFGKHKLFGALAVSNGKNYSVEFTGQEAKQGPYYLQVDGSVNVMIIPGSEEVFLNGIKIQRGSDYTIDYSEGSISFTQKHFITSNTYISASFQYSDENYRKNLYLNSSEVNIFDFVKFRNHLIISDDDKNNPLQDTFSESDLDSLKTAGDGDINGDIWGNGIFEVELGEGSYEYYEDEDEEYYFYAETDTTGNFNIHFENVGVGNGSYNVSESGDYYIYEGPGLGSYKPIKRLYAPQKFANYDFSMDFGSEYFAVKTEGILSSFDKNTLSEEDDGDNTGYAFFTGANINPNFDLINPGLEIYYRRLSENLKTFADLKDRENGYEFPALPDTTETNEIYSKLSLDIYDYWKPSISYSEVNADKIAKQNYLLFNSILKQKRYSPLIDYRFVNIEQDFEKYNETKRSSIHDLSSNYIFKKVAFKNSGYYRKYIFESDIFPDLGNQTKIFKTGFASSGTKKYAFDVAYSDEKFDTLSVNHNWGKERTTGTIEASFSFRSEHHNARMDFSHREVSEEEHKVFDQGEASVSNSFLKSAIDLNTDYSLKNVEFYEKEIKFEEVGESGVYNSEGVISDDEDENTWDYVVTGINYDNPQMSIEVNADFGLFIKPEMITKTFWKRLDSDTFLRMTENSKAEEKSKIYFLSPDVFMNSETTNYGKLDFRQVFGINLIDKKLSADIELKDEKTLDNRYQDNDTFSEKSQDYSFRLSAIKNTILELAYFHSAEEDSRYDLKSNSHGLKTDVRNRLAKNINLTSTAVGTKEAGNNYTLYTFSLSEIVTYYFKRKYKLYSKFEFRRNERTGASETSFFDKNNGNVFKWNIDFDYKISNITSAKLKYSGNSYPGKEDVHKIEIEVKAEF